MLSIVPLLLYTQLKTSSVTLNGVNVKLTVERRSLLAPRCVSVVSRVLAVSCVLTVAEGFPLSSKVRLCAE